MSTFIYTKQSYNGLTHVVMEDYYDSAELEDLYRWVDRVPLSRPKKNIGKDFSDGGEIDFHDYLVCEFDVFGVCV